MKSFERYLYGPGVLRDLDLVIGIVVGAVQLFEIAYEHVLARNRLPLTKLHSSFHDKVDAVAAVYFYRADFECPHLAEPIKHIPLRTCLKPLFSTWIAPGAIHSRIFPF